MQSKTLLMLPSCYRWWIKWSWGCRHSRMTSPPSRLVILVSWFYFLSSSCSTFPNNNMHACAHVSWASGSSIWRTDAAYFALFQTVCSPLSSRRQSHAVDTSRWISVTLTKQSQTTSSPAMVTTDRRNSRKDSSWFQMMMEGLESDTIMVCISVCLGWRWPWLWPVYTCCSHLGPGDPGISLSRLGKQRASFQTSPRPWRGDDQIQEQTHQVSGESATVTVNDWSMWSATSTSTFHFTWKTLFFPPFEM